VTVPAVAFIEVGMSVVTPLGSSLSTTTLLSGLPAGTVTGIVTLTAAANVVPAGPQVTAGPADWNPPWLILVPAWRVIAVALLRAPAGMVTCEPAIVPVPVTVPPLEPMDKGLDPEEGAVVAPLQAVTSTDRRISAKMMQALKSFMIAAP
jgi:hypothetical protein